MLSRAWLVNAINNEDIKFDTEDDKNRVIHLIRDIAPDVAGKSGVWVRVPRYKGDPAPDFKCPFCNTKCVAMFSWRKHNFCSDCGAELIF